MTAANDRWALVLHGGVKLIAGDPDDAHRRGCRSALLKGVAILRSGGTALDAAEATIRCLEDDPTFNAGFGSVLNSDGEVHMDAAIMEGDTLQVGAVAAIYGVRNPIEVARRVLLAPPILLVAEGARRFAAEQGIELCDPALLISPARRVRPCTSELDTVGCVALDRAGTIVAAASTGGLPNKPPGRVGDSPLVGCGFYADSRVGGVAFSGEGERIARMVLASRVMQRLTMVGPQQAMVDALGELERIGGDAGGIVLARDGTVGWAHTTPHFAVAYASSHLATPRVYLNKQEEGWNLGGS